MIPTKNIFRKFTGNWFLFSNVHEKEQRKQWNILYRMMYL